MLEVHEPGTAGGDPVHRMPFGPKALARYDGFQFNQGLGAELICQRWGFDRAAVDEYSVRSHELAAAAADRGAFAE